MASRVVTPKDTRAGTCKGQTQKNRYDDRWIICMSNMVSWVVEFQAGGYTIFSAVDSGGAGGTRAPPEFGGSEKGRSLISAYRSLSITTNTPGFKKLSTALVKNFQF